jgi:uncharacterized MAPEG superfamily protein
MHAGHKNEVEFNCVQRAHQNSLENLPTYFALLLTAGVKASSTGWLAGSWRCFALHSSYYSAGAARLKAAIALPILQYPASA